MDDSSFFSRDPVISNLQSALETYFETQQPDALIEAPFVENDRRRGESGPPATAELSLNGYEPRRDEDGRRVFEKFSVTDPGWVSSALAMGIRLFKHKHKFVDRPATPVTIADHTRIIVVGDWGSGIPRAQKVAREMRKVIEEGKAKGLQQHVIHLGDVYYSGWEGEVKKRFLEYWPVRGDEKYEISSWCLNANHDMYSGGHAYYDELLADQRFARHEGSSMFSLINGQWRILGLDSAWEDHQLKDPQPQWIRQQVQEAQDLGQRVMLLTHHQLFSAFEDGGEHMRVSLRSFLEGGEPSIHAWFWAHEHRCVLYTPHLNVRFARCIGHGGVPVYQWHSQDDPVAKPASYEYCGRFKEGLEHWALFGFAVLDIGGPTIHVRYINEDGEEHMTEQLS